MTSLFSSFIPSSLHFPVSFLSRTDTDSTHLDASPEQEQPQPGDTTTTDDHDVPQPPHAEPVEEEPVVKKREKPSSETFIIVRPPPAKNNHPLNLQIQLVPPHLKGDRANRRSVDFSAHDDAMPDDEAASAAPSETGLTRRPSIRSDRSASLYSTASTSVTSLASTVSGRRVVPLYNLSAHNVIQNTVLDAGTDAKVAKFLKKGVEISQVAYLEPLELWDSTQDMLSRRHTRASDHSNPSRRGSLDQFSSHAGDLSQFQPHHLPSSATLELPSTPGDQRRQSKNPFGKMFKKRNGSVVEAPGSVPELPEPSTPKTPPPSAVDQHLQPPTLGTQPVLLSNSYPPHGRPLSYVWIIRKWLKPTGESWLNKGLGKLTLGPSQGADMGGNVEVRFEWTRARDHGRRGRRKSLDTRESETGHGPSDTGHGHPETGHGHSSDAAHGHAFLDHQESGSLAPPASSMRVSPSPVSKRRSISPRASSLSRAGASVETSSTASDSDPEDSDCPWTCTLHIFPHDRKLRVAALVPAPHHPKLLGQVKVPFPLPDVAVETADFIPRVEGELPNSDGLLMTAEDIKDIIASTCLWLVVREGFGGIDKKRKGDGWRIRS